MLGVYQTVVSTERLGISQIPHAPDSRNHLGTGDDENNKEYARDDDSRNKQKQFEDELEKLRHQLASFNEEEKRVM